MLVGGVLVLLRPFPAREIPNLKTARTADERDLAFQVELLAKIVREHEPALLVGRAVLGARVDVAQKNAEIARGHARGVLGGGNNPREFVRRHDEEALQVLLRDEEEIVGVAFTPPAGGNGDAMFLVDLMPEFSGVESWR